MSSEYLAVPAEAMKQAEKAAKQGFNLTVPESVERNGAVALWSELVVIESATRQDSIGKPKAGHQGGQQRIQYTVRYKIKAHEFDENVGRKQTEFMLVNHGWLHGDESFLGTLPEARWGGETTMTNMSLDKIRSLLVSADYDMSEGLTLDIIEDAFPTKESGNTSGLLGKEFTFRIKDKAIEKGDDITYEQEVAAIFPGPNDE